MRKLWPWILGLTVVLLVGTVVLFGFGLLRNRQMPMFWQDYGGRHWRDFTMPHHRGFRSLPVMGVFGSLVMLILPLGFLGLVIPGIFMLVRAIQKPGQSENQHDAARCNNCGKKVAANWAICPYCGENLGDES